MSKKLKKKLLCLCLLFTLTLQCVPCNVKADDYNDYRISVWVDNQDPDYDYDNDAHYEYIAFTNHAFEGSVSANIFGNNDRFAISIDGTDMSSYIDNQVDSHKYSISKDVIQELYSKGEQHTIKYSVYSGDTEVASKSFILLVKKPYVEYEQNDDVSKSFNVGKKYDIVDDVLSSWNYCCYDWDNPIYGQDISMNNTNYINCELINDESTPDAFELVEDYDNDNYKWFYANSVGKGKLRIRYRLPSSYENYYDENGGYIDVDLVSYDERVYADISSSLTDKNNVVSGSEFSLSVDIKSDPSMNDADEFEREIKSSSWTVPDGLKDKISITPDKNDAKKCTVALSKDIKEDSYEITFEAVYVAADGTDQSVSDTFSFTVIKDKIEISCSVPDYMNVGDTYTIKPELYKYDSNGKTLLKYDYALVQSYSPYAIAVNDNKDGSYKLSDLYRSDDDSVRFYTISVKLKYNGAWIKQSYSIREPRKELELSCYRYNFDGKNDMTLCVDTSGFEMKYDEIKLYYQNNGGDKVAIDNKNYSVKNGNNVIYYTIPAKYLKTLFEAFETYNIYNIYIYAVAVKDGNYIAETYTVLWNESHQTDTVTFGLGDSIYADRDYNISSLVNAVYESENCTWKVDSVKSSDENVISITNNDGSWKYRGNSAGKATVSIDYSIYYKDSVIKDTYSQEIEVNKYTLKATRTDSDQYVYSGDTYYWQLQTFNNENGDSSGEMTNVSYEWSVKNARNMSVACDIIDNELVVTPDNGSLQALGSCQLEITAKDENYNDLATTTIDLKLKTNTYYDAFLDGMTISGDKKSITGVPKLMYYSYKFPDGTDMSGDYSFRISYPDEDNVSVVQNTDGSYTFTQADKAFDTVILEWYDAYTNTAIANCYIEFDGSNQDNTTEVDRKMGLSILNSDSMDMNFYFVSGGDSVSFMKYSFDDGTVKYVPVEYGYWDGYEYYSEQKATICITSGQLTSNIKIELLNDDYEVINTFSQSAESYIKSLLSSDNEKYAKYKPLLKSMLNYGTASQLYFGYNTNVLANRSLSDSDKAVKKVPDKIISKYHAIKKIRIPGIIYCGSSLIVNDEIIVRHYFKVDADRDISNYDFSIDGSSVKPVEKNGMYYVESASDTSSFFGDATVKVGNGHTESYFKYSPLNYISKAYKSDSVDSKLVNLLDAMYWFRYEKVQLNK